VIHVSDARCVSWCVRLLLSDRCERLREGLSKRVDDELQQQQREASTAYQQVHISHWWHQSTRLGVPRRRPHRRSCLV